MPRRNALPEVAATDGQPAAVHDAGAERSWRLLRETDPEMARVLHRNARAGSALARTHESHPAYPELEGEYIAAGIELARLRARRTGRGDPFAGVQYEAPRP